MTQQFYLSRYSNQIFLTQNPYNPAITNPTHASLIKEFQLDLLQSNLRNLFPTPSDTSILSHHHLISIRSRTIIDQLHLLDQKSIITLSLQDFHSLLHIHLHPNQFHKLDSQLDSHLHPNHPILPTEINPSNSISSSTQISLPNPSISIPSISIHPNLSSISLPPASATIFQKNQILDWYYLNGKNQTRTAKHFQSIYPELRIKQPLISSWLKHEQSIRARKNLVNQNVKRIRTIQHPKIDDLLGDWVHEAIKNKLIINDHVLREKWREFARLENIPPQDWLHLSHGWLTSFKVRKGLKDPRPQNRRKSSNSTYHPILVNPAHPETSSSISRSTHQHPPLPKDFNDKNLISHSSSSSSQPQTSSAHLPVSTHSLQSDSHPESSKNQYNSSHDQNPSQPIPTKTTSHPTMADLFTNQSSQFPSTNQKSTPISIRTEQSHLIQPRRNQPTVPTTAIEALNSIETLLDYLPTTITITSNETQAIIHLINSLNDYKNKLVEKINLNSISIDNPSSTTCSFSPPETSFSSSTVTSTSSPSVR